MKVAIIHLGIKKVGSTSQKIVIKRRRKSTKNADGTHLQILALDLVKNIILLYQN